MVDEVPGREFETPVRIRVGDGVGRIVKVGEAIDWIRYQDPDLADRFRHALAVLQHAMRTGGKDDIAVARDAFVTSLSIERLLVD